MDSKRFLPRVEERVNDRGVYLLNASSRSTEEQSLSLFLSSVKSDNPREILRDSFSRREIFKRSFFQKRLEGNVVDWKRVFARSKLFSRI